MLLAHELASAAWERHGEHLITAQSDGRLVVVRADGTAIYPIELDIDSDDYVAFAPSYSTGGNRAVFSAEVAGADADIYTANPDGSNVVQVSESDAPERFPSWAHTTETAPPTTYTSTTFVVPCEVTPPDWLPPGTAPTAEPPHVVTHPWVPFRERDRVGAGSKGFANAATRQLTRQATGVL